MSIPHLLTTMVSSLMPSLPMIVAAKEVCLENEEKVDQVAVRDITIPSTMCSTCLTEVFYCFGRTMWKKTKK
jgi:hypothetical protein